MSRLVMVLLGSVVVVMLVVLYPATGLPSGRSIPDHVLQALQSAEQFEMLSLDPQRPREKPAEEFHSWKVLGRTRVEVASREKIVEALKSGVFWHNSTSYRCFNPRHGIRLTRGAQTMDLVICFECRQVEVYIKDERAEGFLVSGSPQSVFDETLRSARVPLPPEK